MINTYSLQLADNQGWSMLFSKKILDFFSPVPVIASLSPFFRDNTDRLIFSEKIYKEDEQDPLRWIPGDQTWGMPRHGWRKNEYYACDYWFHPESDDILCFLDLNHQELKECPPSSLRFWKSTYLFNPLMLGIQKRKGLHLHGALVEYQGMGAIIAAPGNVGKSTTCRRLPETWKVHCDDNSLIVRGEDGKFYAHPLPTWTDYMRDSYSRPFHVQHYLPLYGIFFLEQADYNELSPMDNDCAVAYIFGSAVQVGRGIWKILNEKDRSFYHHLAVSQSTEVSKEIPGYHLRLSRTGNFWEMLEVALEK